MRKVTERRAEGGHLKPTTNLAVPTTTHKPAHHHTRHHSEDRDKHVAFSPERTTIIHQTDAPPKSISTVAPVATRYVPERERRRTDENLDDLSRKAKSEMEARMRAEEVARTVRNEAGTSGAKGYGGTGRRLGRDIVVVR